MELLEVKPRIGIQSKQASNGRTSPQPSNFRLGIQELNAWQLIGSEMSLHRPPHCSKLWGERMESIAICWAFRFQLEQSRERGRANQMDTSACCFLHGMLGKHLKLITTKSLPWKAFSMLYTANRYRIPIDVNWFEARKKQKQWNNERHMFREVLHYRTLFKSLRSLSNNPKGLSLLPNELLANSGLILWEMLGVGIRHDMSIHTGTQMRKYKIRYMQHSVYVQYRQTDRQTGRQTDRQAGRPAGRQTDTMHTHNQYAPTVNTHTQSIHT